MARPATCLQFRPAPFEVAVIIPCYNEEQTIGGTIAALRAAFAGTAYRLQFAVCDNASTDETARVAREAGALVYRESHKGKGNAVRRLFMEVDADVYLMTDGDLTYDAGVGPEMVRRVHEQSFDMVTAVRRHTDDAAYRRGHQLGNRAMTWTVNTVFGQSTDDVFSGYRAFSRRFVKSFPVSSRGFEIETELTAHACEMRSPVSEIDCRYFPRPAGSASKLSTYRDGLRIARTILDLFRLHRPLTFYGSIAVFFAVLGVIVGSPVIVEYLLAGYIRHVPLAILAAGIEVLAGIALTCALILDAISRFRVEVKRMNLLKEAA
jgi:glycosyltransferase involved in cell wall biosynthesis